MLLPVLMATTRCPLLSKRMVSPLARFKVNTGLMLSMTFTTFVTVVVLFSASLTTIVIVRAVAISLQFKVNGDQVKEVMPQLSVALATTSFCWMVYEPLAFKARVTVPATLVTTGAELSLTNTVRVTVVALPLASVAVKEIV